MTYDANQPTHMHSTHVIPTKLYLTVVSCFSVRVCCCWIICISLPYILSYSCSRSVRSVLTSRLVQATASNVANPFDHIVVRVVEFRLEHFQVANLEDGFHYNEIINRTFFLFPTHKETNLETRWCKWNLKIHGNWRPCPFFLRVRLQKFNFCRQLRFLHTGHSLDSVKIKRGV